jgi:hypothetical protein
MTILFRIPPGNALREGFEQWLQKWVLGLKDHDEFLDLLGKERVSN